MRDIDLAYLAGIVDGEGHVEIKPRRIGIVLCMADIPILEWCHETFGGNLSSSWKQEGGNARPRRMWFLRQSHGLYDIGRALRPYLVLKRREVEIMLEVIEHSHDRPGAGSALFPVWKAERAALCDRAHAAMLARKT